MAEGKAESRGRGQRERKREEGRGMKYIDNDKKPNIKS